MDVPSKIPLDTEAGVISELFVEHAFEDVLSRSDDREQMAAVGAVAAALGLSGPSAGMAVMSSEGGGGASGASQVHAGRSIGVCSAVELAVQAGAER